MLPILPAAMLKDLFTEELIETALGRNPRLRGKDRPKTIAVFKNAFVEHVLARAHWITPGVWFLPPAAYGMYRGFTSARYGWPMALGLFALGWLIWSFIEYALHRFLFHALEPTEEHPERYLAHAYHHDFPDDPMRLVMVPMGSWPLAVLFGALFRLAFGADHWMPAFSGAMVGYVGYDWIHYYTHHARPRGGVGKWLRMYHLQHHHDHRPARYGVSSPLWDLVFGTYVPLKSAAKSQGDAVS